jgi:hypothetical protein
VVKNDRPQMVIRLLEPPGINGGDPSFPEHQIGPADQVRKLILITLH